MNRRSFLQFVSSAAIVPVIGSSGSVHASDALSVLLAEVPDISKAK